MMFDLIGLLGIVTHLPMGEHAEGGEVFIVVAAEGEEHVWVLGVNREKLRISASGYQQQILEVTHLISEPLSVGR